jgi:hypothetical protein
MIRTMMLMLAVAVVVMVVVVAEVTNKGLSIKTPTAKLYQRQRCKHTSMVHDDRH